MGVNDSNNDVNIRSLASLQGSQVEKRDKVVHVFLLN